MVYKKRQAEGVILLACLFCFFLCPGSWASVIVYDALTGAGRSVLLKAQKKGFLAPEGGKRVQFFFEDRPVCNGLTGFDGFAYCEFIPERHGRFNVTVKAEDETGKGSLYVLSRKDKVFFVDVNSVVPQSLSFFLNKEELTGPRKALKKLSRRFILVYTSATIGFTEIKVLIKKVSLPEGPVLEYYDGLFSELRKNKVNLYGILCSGVLCFEAREYFKRAFSFDETDYARKIDEWDDLLRMIER